MDVNNRLNGKQYIILNKQIQMRYWHIRKKESRWKLHITTRQRLWKVNSSTRWPRLRTWKQKLAKYARSCLHSIRWSN